MPTDAASPPRHLAPRSGRTWPLEPPRRRGDDGAPLMLTALPGLRREAIDRGTRSLWRCRRALPVGPGGERTCATAPAAFANLIDAGTIRRGETTVPVHAGTGLKATERIAALTGMES